MEKEIPKYIPKANEQNIIKPLEISSNSSSISKINKNIFNDMYNNNQINNVENEKKEMEKNYSHKILNRGQNISKKNLKLNIKNANAGINVNIVEGVIPNKKQHKNKNLETQKIPKTSPYDFKYFYNTANKKSINQALPKKNFKAENKDLESNFIKLSKEANLYTSNAEYITNKKFLLFDKYDFENNNYRPNRAKLFDMTEIPKSKNIICNTLYKTTKFRGGKMFFFDNKSRPKILDNIIKEDINIKNKKPLYLVDIEKSQDKMNEKILKKEQYTKYIDNTFQKHKRHPPSNSLYKELMNKKNEIYDNYMNKIGLGDINNSEQNFTPNITFPIGLNDEEKMKKIKSENLYGFNGLLAKKKNDGIIPITYPLICSNMLKCDSMSQRKRYENIMETFTKLKSMIENDKNLGKLNENQYIIDFISNKNIEKKFITKKNLENFQNFLECDIMPIDIGKSLKENIIMALNYQNDENNKNENEKSKDDNRQEINIKKQRPLKVKSNLILNDKNIFNINPLEYDIPRQKKLLSDRNYKSAYEIRDSLKKELEYIENEVENKQNKINKIEQNLNLLPFESDYFYKQNLKAKKNKKEAKKDLRLISIKEFNKMNSEQNNNDRKINNKYNLYDLNERLYYTWYKNKNIGNLQHYKNQTKLTEYIIYNRTHEQILDKKIEEIAEQKELQMKKMLMTK